MTWKTSSGIQNQKKTKKISDRQIREHLLYKIWKTRGRHTVGKKYQGPGAGSLRHRASRRQEKSLTTLRWGELHHPWNREKHRPDQRGGQRLKRGVVGFVLSQELKRETKFRLERNVFERGVLLTHPRSLTDGLGLVYSSTGKKPKVQKLTKKRGSIREH